MGEEVGRGAGDMGVTGEVGEKRRAREDQRVVPDDETGDGEEGVEGEVE